MERLDKIISSQLGYSRKEVKELIKRKRISVNNQLVDKSDYKINLVEIRKLEDTSVFKTDVRQVFDFIRCSNDKNALKKLFVIYSRKSKFTGKGESIENQIEMCRRYIATHYSEEEAEQALVYEDEGFSGGNLERPRFKKMMRKLLIKYLYILQVK